MQCLTIKLQNMICMANILLPLDFLLVAIRIIFNLGFFANQSTVHSVGVSKGRVCKSKQSIFDQPKGF